MPRKRKGFVTAVLEKNYWHLRLIDPGYFVKSSYRTQDVGRKGSNMRIAAIKKSTGKWATQSWRIYRSNVKVVKKGNRKTLSATNIRTAKILAGIRSMYGRIVVR